jgi:hypothetical protein
MSSLVSPASAQCTSITTVTGGLVTGATAPWVADVARESYLRRRLSPPSQVGVFDPDDRLHPVDATAARSFF